MTKLESLCSILNDFASSSPLSDSFGVQEMLVDITFANVEIILKSHRQILPKINDLLAAYDAKKSELEAAKKELIIKEKHLESAKTCSNCIKLEKDLARSKKKSAINENRIKTIAKLLNRELPCTEEIDCDYGSDDSSVAKAYNVVSQMLGYDPARGCDESQDVSVEVLVPTIGTAAADKGIVEESICEEVVENMPRPLEEGNKQERKKEVPCTPKKHKKPLQEVRSPVFGKTRRTPSNKNDLGKVNNVENIIVLESSQSPSFIPPSPENEGKSKSAICGPNTTPKKNKISKRSPRKSPGKIAPKRKADFWELKTTHNVDVDGSSVNRTGKKLKQAQLSFRCAPDAIDVCSLREFNGGLRQSQTSTQVASAVGNEIAKNVPQDKVKKHERSPLKQCVGMNEDLILESPQAQKATNKQKSRLIRKLSLGVRATSDSNMSSMKQEKENPRKNDEFLKNFDDFLNDVPKKSMASPPYKYREGPVRKKEERKKLEGWDCENCKQYYEACGNLSDSERKKYMNRCSRHRDKHPIRVNTPPGFWDVDFPDTLQLDALNRTHTDILLKKKGKD